jgi:dTDP-4-dehydrorhamnose reductase
MKILLLGKNGQIGWELQRSLSLLGDLIATDRREANLEDQDSLRRCVRQHLPDIIVNAAAWTAVDKAESEPDKAARINAEAAGILAEEAARLDAWLIHYSTDYVFDGNKPAPYDEEDTACPLSVYGRTKLQGEQLIRQHAKHLIFRTSWVYAARGDNFAKTMLRLAREKETLKIVDDQHGAPTSAELVADVTALALYRMAASKDSFAALAGTYHLTASGDTSWYGYARYVLELAQANGLMLKIRPEAMQPVPAAAYPSPAARPANSRLNTTKLARTFDLNLPDWRDHVRRLVDELTMQGLP